MTSVFGLDALPPQVTVELYEENDASGTLVTTIATSRNAYDNIMRFDGNAIANYTGGFASQPSTTQIIAQDASGNWSNTTDSGPVDISYAVQETVIHVFKMLRHKLMYP